MKKKVRTIVLVIALVFAVAYGTIRLYYWTTGGFTEGNIVYDHSPDPRWETHSLTSEKREEVANILNQTYEYLGKGCQSYVFASQDGKYVIKFLKYQRFRPRPWLEWFSFIPAVDKWRIRKVNKKSKKLNGVYASWKIAYELLPSETGTEYVHLNKRQQFTKPLHIIDKLGIAHSLNINNIEFILQRRVEMICPTLERLAKEGNHSEGKEIIDNLIHLLVSEYQRGLADNDHALMQNTGIVGKEPIHVDVGQFISNDIVKDPTIWKRELFNKTYKFKMWLRKNCSDFSNHLEQKLIEIIGPEYGTMKPYYHQGDVAKIPNTIRF